MRLKIIGGRLFDPASGWEGEERDLYLEDGRIVPHLPEVDRVLTAPGQLVTPAGIELRGQVATFGLNLLRCRDGGLSPAQMGRAYAALGYTHVHEPFLTLNTAKYVHRELAALALVDTSASLVVNLRELDIWLKTPEKYQELGETLQYLLEQTRSLNLRIIEPLVRYRQDFYAFRSLEMEPALEVLTDLARAFDFVLTLEASPELLRLNLPEPSLCHLASLGPALVNEDLLETALKHLQQGATADLGLMLPGDAQGQATKPILIDLGLYRHLNLSPRCPQDQAKRALRLALGYHGNRLAFSGAGWHLAPVREYPRLFSWLCHREARRVDWQEEISPRCYSVSEWVWMTRTLPAKLLGLNDRGTLQPGARADLALYDPPQSLDRPESLSLGLCRTLLKAGEVVMEDYRLVKPKVATATYYRRSGAEAGPLVKEICQYRSFRPENLWVRPEVDTSWEVV